MVEWSSRGAAIHLEILVLHEREEVEGSGTLQMAACLPHTVLNSTLAARVCLNLLLVPFLISVTRSERQRDVIWSGSLRLPRNENDATMLDMMVKGSN